MASKLDLIVKALGLIDKEALDRLGDAAKDIIDGVKTTYGPIYRRTEAEVDGKKGWLIWDYMLFNEITFQDEDGNIMSFFNSISDKQTEAEWDKLVQKYGK